MVSHQAAGVALDGAGATAQRDWRARAVGGLLLTAQWLFLLTIAFLPIDVYLTLPTQQTGVFLSQVLAIEAVGMLVVGLLAGKVLGRATGLQLAWKDLLPLGFVLAAAALSIPFATSRSIAIKDGLKVFVFLGIYLLARAYRDRWDVRRHALLLMLIGFFIVLISGLLPPTGGIPNTLDLLLNIHHSSAAIPHSTLLRAESTFRYPNELAAYLLIALPILLSSIISFPQRFERSAGLVLFALGVYLLVISYTRGALVALAITLPILLFRLAGRRLGLVGITAVIGGAVLIGLVGGVSSERILSVFSLQTSGYSERIAAWQWAWGAFIHHPLFGVGIGNLTLQPNAPYIDQALGLREINAENLLLNVLAEMGIVGLLAVLSCLVGAFRMVWRASQSGGSWVERAWNNGLFVALCGLCIFGLSDPVLVSGQVTGLLCAGIGLAGVAPGAVGARAATRQQTLAERLRAWSAQIAASGGQAAVHARVIFLINAPFERDETRHALNLAADLWRRGVGVLAVVPPDSLAIQRLTAQGVPCLEADLGGNIDRWPRLAGLLAILDPLRRRRLSRLLEQVAQAGPAIFVCPFLGEQVLVTSWSQRRETRVVWILPSTPRHRSRRLPLWRRWTALAGGADAVIVPSPRVAAEVRELGLPAWHIGIAPSAVLGPQFAEEPPAERTPGLLVVVARLTKSQGIQYLIEALPRVLERHPNVRLAIVGTGRYERALYRKVYGLWLEHHVDFLGAIPDTSTLLREASLCIYPSIDPRYVLPMSLLEAFAAGTPVIASAIAGIPDLIVDQHRGILSWPGDAASLANAIIAMLDDPAHAREMGRAGREMARAIATRENTGARWLQMLMEVERGQDTQDPRLAPSRSTHARSEKESGDA